MNRIALAITAAALAAGAAVAQTPAVDAARARGQVGERFDGYLGIVSPASSALRAEVGRVNIERRALYSRLAASKGATPQDVAVTAGCQLLARVPVGGAYLLNDGVWRRRAAGAAAPVPAYCG